ncbi:MAG: AcrB/AcrD/AcrF family protein [Acidobacteria bacterium]|nr:MAG: AcrB/AcrD/AcrF family protein [Acidobacteriota bacterium]
MSLVGFSIRRPVTVFIFAVAAALFGVVAFRQLAVDLLPDITYPSLTVRTDYPGTAPTEVESLVSRPVENAVGVVNNVVRVTSSSRPDVSEVTLEFAWGTNMDFASLDVRERLDVVRLPLDAEQPVLLRFDPSLDPILRIGLTASGDEVDLTRLRLIGEEEVKRVLERVEGVAAVIVSGGLEEEIQVELDERRITALGLTTARVLQRLAQENINLTGGRLRDGQTEFLVRTVNEFVRPEDVRDVVVDRQGGATVRLADVARVYMGAKEREVITRIDGRESVEVAIYKEGGTNTVQVADRVLEAVNSLDERLERLGGGLELTVVTNQARYIEESVRAVIDTAAMGGLLAILVLYVFLRSLKNTLIIGISIPVSVMATFFLMYVSGVSLNIMSLGGLTLGIGLLVDNSIVVLEAIQRRRDQGLGIEDAAREGASEVSTAVVASTLTTICVFAPIVFVEGVAGQMFGDQALTVTFSLVVSLAVALTVIPMLASRPGLGSGAERPRASELGQGNPLTRGFARGSFAVFSGLARLIGALVRGAARFGQVVLDPPLRLFDRGLERLRQGYGSSLETLLARPLQVLVTVAVLLAASLLMARSLGTELVPELVQGEFFVDAELEPGTRLEITDRRLRAVEAVAAELPRVETVYAVAGTSNEQGGSAGETRENIGQITLLLETPSTREGEDELIRRIGAYIEEQNESYSVAGVDPEVAAGIDAGVDPGLQATGLAARNQRLEHRFGRPSYFSFRTPIEVEIRGYNLELLERLADQVIAELSQVEGLSDLRSSTEGGNPEIQIRFDRDRLARLGLTVGQLGEVLRTKIQGDIATDVIRDDRNIEIRLRTEEQYRDSVRDLANLNVAQEGRTPIPLSAVAAITESVGPAEIRRADGSRVARITANLLGRDLGAVSDELEARLQAIEFPSGFDWSLRGQRQEMETSYRSLRTAILLAIFMVYLVMASQFESLLHPFVILFSVPFSVIGALLALRITGTPVSIVVLIGAILLAGIVVNNAIILVDTANRLRRDEAMPKLEALREAGLIRLRPILMTTATTVLGLLPMAIGFGEGSELRTPLALTVVGGLLTSTLLTLLVVPVVYRTLDRSP